MPSNYFTGFRYCRKHEGENRFFPTRNTVRLHKMPNIRGRRNVSTSEATTRDAHDRRHSNQIYEGFTLDSGEVYSLRRLELDWPQGGLVGVYVAFCDQRVETLKPQSRFAKSPLLINHFSIHLLFRSKLGFIVWSMVWILWLFI